MHITKVIWTRKQIQKQLPSDAFHFVGFLYSIYLLLEYSCNWLNIVLALPGHGLHQVKTHEETLSEATEILAIISLQTHIP